MDPEAILGPPPDEWPSEVRSRVIKDVFHLMHVFPLSQTHGAKADFCRALRDALLIPDPMDSVRVSAWGALQNPPVTLNQLRITNPKWLWKRVKRFIAGPEVIWPRVREVLLKYGPTPDAKTHQPLFNAACWKVAKSVLDLIRRGFVSDPPGVALYTNIGVDKKTGLPLYRCFRGTNFTEGGIHTHLRPHLPTSGASVEHVIASLCDHVLHHNLIVSSF